MADQHNSNIPAIGNQISADIPDIKENLEFHKDAFQVIFETWSDSDNSSAAFDTAPGFSDGTYTYDFPTNGVAGNSIIMLGNSSTIVWMYLNTAPPGWKALSTGADTVLGVSGGTGDYNVDGGNPDSSATWSRGGHTLTTDEIPAHTHGEAGAHTHSVYYATGSGALTGIANSVNQGTVLGATIANAAASGGAHTHNSVGGGGSHDHGDTWRPSASVGKLFQLDTA